MSATPGAVQPDKQSPETSSPETSSPEARSPESRGPGAAGLEYQPALDGLRGIAVAAVLLFHGGFPWASGGYLGVSVFFTLSGFLITNLLLAELTATGTIDLPAFYVRRLKRLLPASVVCVLGVVVLNQAGIFDDTHRSDVLWTALQAANWHQLTDGQSYASLFTRPTPLEHFWSLAVEEQFYVVWPCVFLATAVLVCRRRSQRITLVACALFTSTAAAAPLIAHHWGADAAYLSTPARAAEIFAGVLAACLLRRRSVPRWSGAVGLLSGGVILLAFVVTPASSGWAYEGWLPAFAVLSCLLIVGLQADSACRRVVGIAPLVALGRISYGVYLFHWPVFVVLSSDRLGVDGTGLFVLRMSVTFLIAIASFRWIEQPVRTSWSRRPVVLIAGSLAIGLCAVGAFTVQTSPTVALSNGDIDRGQAEMVALREERPAPTAAPTSEVPTTSSTAESRAPIITTTLAAVVAQEPATTNAQEVDPRPLRVLITGDSTAAALGSGMVEWAAGRSAQAQVSVEASGSCGLVRGGQYEEQAFTAALEMTCADLIWTDVPGLVAQVRPDVVVIYITLADTWRRSWDGGSTWNVPTDPSFAARLRDDYSHYIDTLIAAGAKTIVWLRPPVSSYGDDRNTTVDASFLDGSQQLVEQIIDEQVAAHPTAVRKLDLRSWFEAQGLDADHDARPDGTHLTTGAASEIVDVWLAPQLRSLVG